MTVLTATPISLPVSMLLSDVAWTSGVGAPLTVSYNFLTQVPSSLLEVVAGDPAENVGWAPLTAQQQAETVHAMATLSAVANISFVASADSNTAQIIFGTNDQVTSAAYTSYGLGGYFTGGKYLMAQDHIEISNNEGVDLRLNEFTADVLHELANATGLQDFVIDKSIPAAVNDLYYSVQSYEQYNDFYTSQGPGGIQPVTPQILDILGWQYLYGANQNGYTSSTYGATESHLGNNHTYRFTDDTAPMTVWIGANVSGVNCFDFSACTGPVSIDLTPGTLSGTGQYVGFGPNQAYGWNNFYQNVGLAYGTMVQVGVGNDVGDTFYADATTGHHSLLIGGKGADTFVAGNGDDMFVSNGGADIVQFHDPYADYKIVAAASGGTLVLDQAINPKDGTVTLSGGFAEMQFGDGTNIDAFPPGPAAASLSAVVETTTSVPLDLDTLQAGVVAGYIHQIVLTDSGVSNIQISAAQSVQDVQALVLITSPYSLSIEMPTTGADGQGPGNGIATTIVLPEIASQYGITASSDGSITLSDGGQVDHLSSVTTLQFADHTVFVASTAPSIAGGVSSAQITTLYAGTLGRLPDASGLAYYENQAAKSSEASIVTYAEYFLSSPEYAGNSAHSYAQTSAGDAQFVTDVYSDLLHRSPEAGAVAWYQANVLAPILQNGVAGTVAYAQAELMAHATVLSYFSQSPEFLGDVTVTTSHPVDAEHWLVLA